MIEPNRLQPLPTPVSRSSTLIVCLADWQLVITIWDFQGGRSARAQGDLAKVSSEISQKCHSKTRKSVIQNLAKVTFVSFSVRLHAMSYIPRAIDYTINLALESVGAVLLEGPRGCGKTETGLHVTNSQIRLDQSSSRELALLSPSKALEGLRHG